MNSKHVKSVIAVVIITIVVIPILAALDSWLDCSNQKDYDDTGTLDQNSWTKQCMFIKSILGFF